jgi:hypothetical protein
VFLIEKSSFMARNLLPTEFGTIGKPGVQRVDELVRDSFGERFVPRPGKLMKEWLVVAALKADCVELAREACDFVGRSKA